MTGIVLKKKVEAQQQVLPTPRILLWGQQKSSRVVKVAKLEKSTAREIPCLCLGICFSAMEGGLLPFQQHPAVERRRQMKNSILL